MKHVSFYRNNRIDYVEITVTKVFIMANMKNSKSHCKQEVDVL
jgi:hypothetical protein